MENKKGINWKRVGIGALIILSIIYMIIYIVWRAGFTIPGFKEYGWVPFILGIVLLIAEAASALEAFAHCMDLMFKKEPEMPTVAPELFPDVDVFIATHNEDNELLYKTANACRYMDYPDKSKVHIYLCDDGNRPAVKELADSLGVGYFGMEHNDLAKAGNLNNAIGQTSSPLIVTFDADMIPSSNFLYETVPYFFLPKMKKDNQGKWVMKSEDEIDENDKIGFIQTPQSFYNPDLFQYNLYSEGRVPNEQDYFFRQINIGRNNSNAPIYAGSNTVISREALEEVGGICTGTITEDFETGLLIEAKGYKCYAINKLLAKGLSPTTITSLIKQRERWGRGCVHSLRRHHILLNPKFPLKLKMAYMSCRSYWDSFFRRFIFIICPIIFAVLGVPAVVCGFREILLIWLPNYLLYALVLRLASDNVRNTRISNNIDTILFPYLMVPILAEFLHIHKQEFVVTDKKKSNNANYEKLLALPHIIFCIFSVIALVMAVQDLLLYRGFGAIVVIYWLVINSFSLILAVFFMFGRKNYRGSERFLANVRFDMEIDGKVIDATTYDISEGGMSIILDSAIYFDDDDIFDVCVRDRAYNAAMKVKIASVTDVKQEYKYCFQIVDIDEDNKKEYMQIVYDREHTLPKTISMSSSVYGDIASNIRGRITSAVNSLRKLARVNVDREYSLSEGGVVRILNFNFEYMLLEDRESNPEKCSVIIKDDVVVQCQRERAGLYKITNLDALLDMAEFENVITEWKSNNEG